MLLGRHRLHFDSALLQFAATALGVVIALHCPAGTAQREAAWIAFLPRPHVAFNDTPPDLRAYLCRKGTGHCEFLLPEGGRLDLAACVCWEGAAPPPVV
jgi:hypothetical protein